AHYKPSTNNDSEQEAHHRVTSSYNAERSSSQSVDLQIKTQSRASPQESANMEHPTPHGDKLKVPSNATLRIGSIVGTRRKREEVIMNSISRNIPKGRN
ncbi:hypothetical protein Tco_0469942, partial [Tanacetum coccineum]